jgi:hypothetical protein
MTVQLDYEKFLTGAMPGLPMYVGRDTNTLVSFANEVPESGGPNFLYYGLVCERGTDPERQCLPGGDGNLGITVRDTHSAQTIGGTGYEDRYTEGQTASVLRKGYIAARLRDTSSVPIIGTQAGYVVATGEITANADIDGSGILEVPFPCVFMAATDYLDNYLALMRVGM